MSDIVIKDVVIVLVYGQDVVILLVYGQDVILLVYGQGILFFFVLRIGHCCIVGLKLSIGRYFVGLGIGRCQFSGFRIGRYFFGLQIVVIFLVYGYFVVILLDHVQDFVILLVYRQDRVVLLVYVQNGSDVDICGVVYIPFVYKLSYLSFVQPWMVSFSCFIEFWGFCLIT